ncbi:hypothetical protein EAE96_004899 [Botrytis aclada]|nr:hypothetical protein EAE96_004899 [Botrytis aclada]
MHHNTKQGLIFLAFVIACGGGIAAFVLLRNSHNQHSDSGKREIADMNPYNIYARSLPTSAATTNRHVGLETCGFFQVRQAHTHHSTQRRNRHRLFIPDTELGNPSSQFITIPTTTATSFNVQPLSTSATSSASSINIYSSFKVETLSTLLAAAGFQNTVTSSSHPVPDISMISTTPSSPQPLATTGSKHSHLRKFRG